MKIPKLDSLSILLTASVLGLGGLFAAMKAPAPAELDVLEMSELLRHFEVVYLDDGSGNPKKTFRLTGVNLQVVNGLGATNGQAHQPASLLGVTNGLGNLIVGYNERATDASGSHNVVVGQANTYNSFGGLVVGLSNASMGPYCSVNGGTENVASGTASSVGGGQANVAASKFGSVAGGIGNRATGPFSSILGGEQNRALAVSSAIVGGELNESFGHRSTIVGGTDNRTQNERAVVVGGQMNDARATHSVILGGLGNFTEGSDSTISGGRQNSTHVDGIAATVSGGFKRFVAGEFDWRAGDLTEDF